MNSRRRQFLRDTCSGMALAGITSVLASRLAAQQPTGPRRPRPPFPFPSDESNPPELKPDPKEVLKQNQKDIKRDIERLFALAQELKKEVEKTDSAEVLSLQVVRKAEEIEKLARNIKNLARGA